MPTYIGLHPRTRSTTPEVAEKYPIVLTTGGGFMPFHHSEHFQMPGIRYLYPDPYFSINPELAEKLDIADGDWCWIETRRGRIKMRANVEPEVRSQRGVRAARLVVPRARRLGRPGRTRSAASSPTSTC